MKVRLTEALELIVEPESAIEAVALRFWGENFNPERELEAKLIVRSSVDFTDALTGEKAEVCDE